MSNSTCPQGTGGGDAPHPACHRDADLRGGSDDRSRSTWWRKLALTAIGAVLSGIIRVGFDWGLREIHL